jgi:hypothetical protein
LANNINYTLKNKVTYYLSYLKQIFFGNLTTIKKIDDVLEKMDSLQKAQAQTRGQIEGLKEGKSGNGY